MLAEIECPRCCSICEYDTDNDVILCEECGEMIFVEVDEDAQQETSP